MKINVKNNNGSTAIMIMVVLNWKLTSSHQHQFSVKSSQEDGEEKEPKQET
jgi:hypothetical protein